MRRHPGQGTHQEEVKPMTKNELAVLLRKTQRSAKEAIAKATATEGSLGDIKGALNALERAFQGGAMKPLTNRERALAAARDMRPTWLVMSHQFDAQTDGEQLIDRQADTVGRLIVDRIRATWLCTDEGSQNYGMYGFISSPQAGNIDHVSTNVVDFEWSPRDGRNNQNLSNEPIPGDVLARNDGDGFPAGGLVFEPGTPIQIVVNFHRPTPTEGILTFILEGIQCYDQKGAP